MKVVTPDWIIDSLHSEQHLDESAYHPRLLLYEARPPTPPQPVTPEPAPSELTPAPSRTPQLIRSSSTSSRPGQLPSGPTYNYHPHSPKTNNRTKEALARMVSSRMGQMSPGPVSPDHLAMRPMMPGAVQGGRSPRAMLKNITNSETVLMRGGRSPRPRAPRGTRSPRGRAQGRGAKVRPG